MDELTLRITGMSCGHAVAAVKRALDAVDGVQVRDVAVGRATVAYDAAAVSPERIAGAVADAGYDAQPAGTAA